MQKLIQLVLFILLFSGCAKKEAKIDLPLLIVDADTVFLDRGNLRYQNAKFQTFDKGGVLIIFQDRKIWWYDLKKGLIIKSINFDSTNLVLPEVPIFQAKFKEADSSLNLFFPQRSKIIRLNSNLELEKEIDLIGLQEIDHMFIPFGDAFFYDSGLYFIGLMSLKSNDQYAFLQETKFIGIFDENSGELVNTFGTFGEKRKSLEAMVLSEGIFHIDFSNKEFFIREVVADQTIYSFTTEGKRLDSHKIGTSKIDSEIFTFEEGSDFFSSTRSDQFYSMKVTDDGLVVSNTFSSKMINGNLKNTSYLVVEDLNENVSYSTSIDPFQKIIWADNSEIFLVRHHPDKEDMILVKVRYQLGKL